MSVKVKICGVRTAEMADAAITAGADFLGFNFVPASKRYIEPERALEIIKGLKHHVRLVGVFQDARIQIVNETAAALGLDFVQLHGREDPGYVGQVDVPVIKVIRLDDRSVQALLDEAGRYDAAYFLLDRPVQGKGEMIDMEAVRMIAAEFRVFVAGALTPDNVAGVVRAALPYAVDVAGGIETDGEPDMAKIRQFVARTHGGL